MNENDKGIKSTELMVHLVWSVQSGVNHQQLLTTLSDYPQRTVDRTLQKALKSGYIVRERRGVYKPAKQWDLKKRCNIHGPYLEASARIPSNPSGRGMIYFP